MPKTACTGIESSARPARYQVNSQLPGPVENPLQISTRAHTPHTGTHVRARAQIQTHAAKGTVRTGNCHVWPMMMQQAIPNTKVYLTGTQHMNKVVWNRETLKPQ